MVQLTEGGASQTFTIVGLTSEPLQSVDITISTTSNLIQISPSTFTISASNWNNVNKGISLQAVNGNYAGGTTFALSIEASSTDAKYASISVTKTAVVATNDAAPGLDGCQMKDSFRRVEYINTNSA